MVHPEGRTYLFDEDFPGAFDDFPDDVGGKTSVTADLHCVPGGFFRKEPDHPYPHVKDPVGLLYGDVAFLDHEGEYRKDRKDAPVKNHIHVFREHSRDIVVEPAAGDMGDAVERQFLVHGLLDGRPVGDMGFQEGFADRAAELLEFGVDRISTLLEEDASCKAVATFGAVHRSGL